MSSPRSTRPTTASGSSAADDPEAGALPRFHLLSFEGCDAYARAGGLASRVSGLAETLAALGFETHLWFIGDPALPGHEQLGRLHLHRWCQWISRHHPGGVYDGEEGKRNDYVASLPPHLADLIASGVRRGHPAVVLAEEWQTADAVLYLDGLLREQNVRDRARLFWNANNTFGFERIDFVRLARAARITTVSRYMKHLMGRVGIEAVVVPNGLPPDAFASPDREAVRELRSLARQRPVLTKVARWDPDKRWLLTVDIIGELKRAGARPLLVARGGAESHGGEVMARATAAGLRVVRRAIREPGARGLLGALRAVDGADVVDLETPLDARARRLLFRGASAVLANSGHEPFGLVGLEAMAVGGLVCTGCSGEDYVVAGRNALVMQTSTPAEFVRLFARVRKDPAEEGALRRAGRQTARQFAWRKVVKHDLLPAIDMAAD